MQRRGWARRDPSPAVPAIETSWWGRTPRRSRLGLRDPRHTAAASTARASDRSTLMIFDREQPSFKIKQERFDDIEGYDMKLILMVHRALCVFDITMQSVECASISALSLIVVVQDPLHPSHLSHGVRSHVLMDNPDGAHYGVQKQRRQERTCCESVKCNRPLTSTRSRGRLLLVSMHGLSLPTMRGDPPLDDEWKRRRCTEHTRPALHLIHHYRQGCAVLWTV